MAGEVKLVSDNTVKFPPKTKSHKWVRSTYGHGNMMCTSCYMTDLEAMALRCYEVCDGK